MWRLYCLHKTQWTPFIQDDARQQKTPQQRVRILSETLQIAAAFLLLLLCCSFPSTPVQRCKHGCQSPLLKLGNFAPPRKKTSGVAGRLWSMFWEHIPPFQSDTKQLSVRSDSGQETNCELGKCDAIAPLASSFCHCQFTCLTSCYSCVWRAECSYTLGASLGVTPPLGGWKCNYIKLLLSTLTWWWSCSLVSLVLMHCERHKSQ